MVFPRIAATFSGYPLDVADYDRAEVVESSRAVAVVPVPRLRVRPGTAIRAIGCERHVDVRLEEPLGARVLVDVDASPAEVRV